jgi:hypothetical protein
MLCRSCQSSHQEEFGSEIVIHFAGLKNLDKPAMMVFPKLVVCLECGVTEFTIPETELRLLAQAGAASTAA